MIPPPRPNGRRALRRLEFWTVVLYGLVVLMLLSVTTVGVMQRNQIKQIAVSTNSALCVLRSDLEVQVQQSRDFLRSHPNGIPGISPADIQTGITRQERTIKALSGLICGKG